MKPLFGQVKVKDQVKVQAKDQVKVKAEVKSESDLNLDLNLNLSFSPSTSTFPSTLLRVVLTLLLVFVGVKVGLMFAPRLASWTGDGRRKDGYGEPRMNTDGHGFGFSRNQKSGLRSPVSPVRAAQPDWGGGRLSFPDRSAAGIVDSVRTAAGGDSSKTQTYSGPAGGVVLRRIERTEDGRRETGDGRRRTEDGGRRTEDGGWRSEDLTPHSSLLGPESPVSESRPDYALTLAVPSPGQPGRAALFELPSAGHFRKQLFPEGMGTRCDIMSPSCSAEAPAADIPLYPQSRCRMQVGRGTACFVGFYLTPDSIEAVRSFYVRALSRLGWQRVTEDGGRKDGYGEPRMNTDGHGFGFSRNQKSGRRMEIFTKRNEDRTVVVQLRKQDSVTTRIGLVAMTSGMGTRGVGTRSELSDNSVMSPLSDNSVMSPRNERK